MSDTDALAQIEVEDLDGNKRRLGDVWAQRPTAIVWVRHFG